LITVATTPFTEEIISFIHGRIKLTGQSWGESGAQCQSCGKFTSIEHIGGERSYSRRKGWGKIIKKEKRTYRQLIYCTCGGKLEREKPLFCPKCKSTNVEYSMRYCT